MTENMTIKEYIQESGYSYKLEKPKTNDKNRSFSLFRTTAIINSNNAIIHFDDYYGNLFIYDSFWFLGTKPKSTTITGIVTSVMTPKEVFEYFKLNENEYKRIEEWELSLDYKSDIKLSLKYTLIDDNILHYRERIILYE